MREYPETLSHVILDGVVDIAATSWIAEIDQRYERALDYLLSLCDADPACAAAYPNTAENIDVVFEMLEEEPYAFELTEDLTIYVGAEEFAGAIFSEMYTASEFTLPSAVDSYINGEPNAAWTLLMTKVIPPGGIAWLMHYAVVCAEDPIRSTDDVGSTEGITYETILAYGLSDGEGYTRGCEIIDVPQLPDETDDNIVSDTPVLLIHGALDPVTPGVLAEPIRETLTTSYSVEFAYGSHVQLLAGSACAGDIAAQFLANPTTEPDTSCLADEVQPEFLLPDEE